MNKIKVLSIFGTRPEAIKMAPLVKKLEQNKLIDSKVCITAQHRDMLDQVIDLFDIHANYDLDIMKEAQGLVDLTNNIMNKLYVLFEEYTPDIILVHGDTTTTFSASLAAFYKKIKIGHVEAGLRSFDKYFPFPEEVNRKLTSVLADLHFAPTELSKRNLLNEGIDDKSIFVTGNTVIDSMEYTINKNYKFKSDVLNNIDFKNKKVIMVTAHRRENWGEGIENICKSLKRIIEDNEDVEIVYLLHMNPIVRDIVVSRLGDAKRVHLLEPLDTEEAHNLMNKCYMIMTDSGGIQEEAPHLGKPVLVFRDVTERPEALLSGSIKLVGTSSEKITEECSILLHSSEKYNNMSASCNPFGDGYASERIVDAIVTHFESDNNITEI